MKFFEYLFFLLICLFICCTSNKTRRISIDGQIAEGVFLPGNVFNGEINYYDSLTNHLVETGTYKNGVLEEERTTFYPNGDIKTKSVYSNGKVYGFVISFDSFKNVINTQYRYYDLRVGPSIDYKAGNPTEFWYYSLDNELLSHIKYDSILNKKISDITKNY